jgi:hypothetical protein
LPELLLNHPTSDFDELTPVLRGEQLPQRDHLIEISVDPEVLQTIQEICLAEPGALPRGADMDKIATLPEADLRIYLRGILETCTPEGGFAFGSGNSIANYVPLQNYAILLEEARQWKP